MSVKNYSKNVFINCPFDSKFLDLFYAKIFCVIDCGFNARCAKEAVDSGEVRIEKITRIIEQCKYGIHDISRTELCDKQLPRFNMPLELGIFMGAKRYGDPEQRGKICLITDVDKYRYQHFISDIAGQDVQDHRSDPEAAIKLVRHWLKDASKKKSLSGSADVVRRYKKFRKEFPALCDKLKTDEEELTFKDYTTCVYGWLDNQRKLSAAT